MTAPKPLTRLMELYGGYANVTAAAWAEFDAATKAWNEARLQELLAEVMRDKDYRR